MASFSEGAHLAGFMAAHGVWCVADGEVLVPFAAFEKGGERQLVRFVTEELSVGAAKARSFVDENTAKADRAVSVIDGFVTIEGVKRDALIVHAVAYTPHRSLDVVIPYRPRTASGAFAVHKPKFVAHEGLDGELETLGEAFFGGVDAHTEAAKVWNQHLDQSL